jgi:hypothetical protein
MPITLPPKTQRLDGVAVDAVRNDAAGVNFGPATAAVVGTRVTPRTGPKINAYRFADIAKTPAEFELCLFSHSERLPDKRILKS